MLSLSSRVLAHGDQPQAHRAGLGHWQLELDSEANLNYRSTMTRVFYYILVYTVASLDTQCIDSNLESVRYVSRVGRARGFSLSLGTYGTLIGTVGTYLRYGTLYRSTAYKESI